MDTKLTNNKPRRFAGVAVSSLLIFAIAAAVLLSYQPVLRNSQKVSENLQTQREERELELQGYYKEYFLGLLERGNYILPWEVKSKASVGIEPSDFYFNRALRSQMEEEDGYGEKEAFLDEFNEILYQWCNNFYQNTLENYPLLEYYVIDELSGEYRTNSFSSIDRLLTDSQETLELKKRYPFYIIFRYSEEGQLEISDYSGYEQEQMDQLLINYQNREIIRNQAVSSYWYQFINQIEEPNSMTIIYASQSDSFYYHEGIADRGERHPIWDFSEGGLIYVVVVAAAFVALLALLLPFVKGLGLKDGRLTRIPLELSAVGVLSVMAFYDGLLTMAWETTTGFFITQPSQTILSEKLLHILDYSLNYVILVLLGAIIYVSVLSFRQLFVIGLRRYIREQTITGRVGVFFARWIKRVIQSLVHIDLTDKSNKAILRIVLVNFIILALLCSIWVFGIAVLIPYSILLFFLMRKYVNDIKKKYSILLKAASMMAEGNLDVVIEEDIGVFEPLKKEFAKVQHGFKKAVEEEMKSQRMKTDLITNVSHDLKTPLTAIITYVSLLKDENITSEERASYIDTLDMKSQRLKHLIEDLFEVSKASSNNVTLNRIEVDISGLIKQVLLELDDKLSQTELELRLNLPEEKVLLNLDSAKTYRIFENLIINIAKYAMPRSRAYITMEVSEHKVTVILKNTSALELSFNTMDITERFVRGDQSRNTEGSGLGLAIVKSFVELQGGTFEILIDGDLFKAIITWMR